MKYPKTSSCDGKRQFLTYKEAERNLRGLRRVEPDKKSLHIYSCNYCPHFHVGHEVIKRRKHV